MDTVVLKFGGSSVADNIKLNIVAQKIIDLYKEKNRVVVVVSAQGKTTDRLIKEAKELSNMPDDREMDVLLSCGEQISMSKLAILLNRLGYKAISLTGMQAGIITNNCNQNAKIECINTERIEEELEQGKIVIVAGFQGVNNKKDITTLGRGGSDTTAVAIAAALKAKHCYIFSDVDGIYTTDPNKVKEAKKLETLSYVEMLDMSNEGAKVLHNRCVEVGKKYNVPIIAKSTFNDNDGTILQDKIEDTSVKGIVKNDDIIYVNLQSKTYYKDAYYNIFNILTENKIVVNYFKNNSNNNINISFTIKSSDLNRFQYLLENDFKCYEINYFNISKIAIIGHGIMNNNVIIKNVMKILENNNLEIYNLEINESKIAITFKDVIENSILEQLHKELIY